MNVIFRHWLDVMMLDIRANSVYLFSLTSEDVKDPAESGVS